MGQLQPACRPYRKLQQLEPGRAEPVPVRGCALLLALLRMLLLTLLMLLPVLLCMLLLALLRMPCMLLLALLRMLLLRLPWILLPVLLLVLHPSTHPPTSHAE